MELPVNYDKLTSTERKLVRDEYVRKQAGNCQHCGASLDGPPEESIRKKPVNSKWFPEGFFNNPVHLHHNHNTGLTIGAVHCHCNAVLWQYHGE